jgi:hypothetical protein
VTFKIAAAFDLVEILGLFGVTDKRDNVFTTQRKYLLNRQCETSDAIRAVESLHGAQTLLTNSREMRPQYAAIAAARYSRQLKI